MKWIMTSENFGVARVAGLGNKIDIEEAEVLEFLGRDPGQRFFGEESHPCFPFPGGHFRSAPHIMRVPGSSGTKGFLKPRLEGVTRVGFHFERTLVSARCAFVSGSIPVTGGEEILVTASLQENYLTAF